MKNSRLCAKTVIVGSIALALILLAGRTLFGPASALAQDTIPFFQPGKIRVLIFSGRNNHDWRTTTPFLHKFLVDSGRFDVRVEEEPVGVTAATLAAYDVLVLDYQGPRWGKVTEKAVVEFRQSAARDWWPSTRRTTPLRGWRSWPITTSPRA